MGDEANSIICRLVDKVRGCGGSIECCQVGCTNGLRGVVASSSLKEKFVVFRIPFYGTLAPNCLKERVASEVCRPMMEENCNEPCGKCVPCMILNDQTTGWAVICACVLAIAQRTEGRWHDLHFKDYIDSLPKREETPLLSTLKDEAPEEYARVLRNFGWSMVAKSMDFLAQRIQEVYQGLTSSHGRPCSCDVCTLTIEDFEWGYRMALSRTFEIVVEKEIDAISEHVNGKHLVRFMVPYADMFNHSVHPCEYNVHFRVDEEGHAFEVVTHMDVQAGSQMFFSYGSRKPIEHFAVSYGFVPRACWPGLFDVDAESVSWDCYCLAAIDWILDPVYSVELDEIAAADNILNIRRLDISDSGRITYFLEASNSFTELTATIGSTKVVYSTQQHAHALRTLVAAVSTFSNNLEKKVNEISSNDFQTQNRSLETLSPQNQSTSEYMRFMAGEYNRECLNATRVLLSRLGITLALYEAQEG